MTIRQPLGTASIHHSHTSQLRKPSSTDALYTVTTTAGADTATVGEQMTFEVKLLHTNNSNHPRVVPLHQNITVVCIQTLALLLNAESISPTCKSHLSFPPTPLLLVAHETHNTPDSCRKGVCLGAQQAHQQQSPGGSAHKASLMG